jgi:hypothetical protein
VRSSESNNNMFLLLITHHEAPTELGARIRLLSPIRENEHTFLISKFPSGLGHSPRYTAEEYVAYSRKSLYTLSSIPASVLSGSGGTKKEKQKHNEKAMPRYRGRIGCKEPERGFRKMKRDRLRIFGAVILE